MFMIEKALAGGKRYWGWLAALAAVACLGALAYSRQLGTGLGVTGLSRDVSWGLYVAQFTFFVGVAASAVVVVLPYYLHDHRAFGRLTILGEFVAIAAVVMCGLFIFVDMGQPSRILNVLLHPAPRSMMFWDMLSLGGYLALNVVITRVTLEAERNGSAPPAWIRPVIVLSIPWAISIHTVTAFLYSGLPGRSFWLTAVMAPRFLASAFAAGPALLVIVALIVRRLAGFDAGREGIGKLAVAIAYALTMHVFLVLLELFTVLYSQVPEHVEHYRYLYLGLEGGWGLAPFLWLSSALAVLALVVLLSPRLRRNESFLAAACLAVFVSLWLDKGLALIVGGFVPSPLGRVSAYVPTITEVGVTAGVWAVGLILVTVFVKILMAVRRDAKAGVGLGS